MLKNLLIGIIFIAACLSLVNKFYLPGYCDTFSWKSVQYSYWEVEWMKKCVDNKICKIWNISNNALWNVEMKTWKCEPLIDEFHVWE